MKDPSFWVCVVRRRPLFWICIALSVIAVMHLWMSGATKRGRLWEEDKVGNGGRWASSETQNGKERTADSKDEETPPWEGQTICLRGRVCGREVRGDKETFYLTKISTDQISKSYSENISETIQNAAASRQIISLMKQMKTDRIQCQVTGDPYFTLPKIGSEVVVTGEFALFSESTNPGEFNTAEYQQGRRVAGTLSNVKILYESTRHDALQETLYQLREYFGARLSRIFPEREAGAMRTILLGDRSELSSELKEIYQDGGIVHILSISGLHVTLLGMGLYELLRKLGVRGSVACVIASIVLILYGIMTGMSVSACRAIGMFLLRCLASLWGRTYDLLTALGVMMCGMLCFVPVYGVNSGFWLSFGSILGIGVILPVLERKGRGKHWRDDLKNARGDHWKRFFIWLDWGAEGILGAFSAGASVLLASLPLSLLFYYEVPTYSMLLNLIVIPMMGVVLFFGMIAMAVPGLGILGTVDVVALRVFEKICLWTRDLPFSSWNPGCPRTWQVIAYYVLLGMALWLFKVSKARGKEEKTEQAAKKVERTMKKGENSERLRKLIRMRGVLACMACFVPILIFLIPARRMTGVVFLDVGQGDCVILRLSNGQTWISDCGSSNKSEVGKNILVRYLKHEGIRHVDGVFVSHGDRDHVNGIKELFAVAKKEDIQIDWLFLPRLGGAGEDAVAGAGESTRAKIGDGVNAGTAGAGESTRAKTGDGVNAGTAGAGESTRAKTSDGVNAETAGAGTNYGSMKDVSKELQDVLDAAGLVPGLKVCELSAGDVLRGDQLIILVLHPMRSEEALPDSNENSLCLWVELEKGDRRLTVLLTGDVEGTGEAALLEEMKRLDVRKVDVLKCAHHGSKNATSEDFLEQLDASYVVISCGRKNRYGHPAAELLERLSGDGTIILRTDEQGAIILR